MFQFGAKYESIQPHEIQEYLKKGSILVDIRNEEAFRSGHIKGAKNIPIAQLATRMKELDKEKDILLVCYVGGSSKMAAGVLAKAGYQVKNVVGGMQAVESALGKGYRE